MPATALQAAGIDIVFMCQLARRGRDRGGSHVRFLRRLRHRLGIQQGDHFIGGNLLAALLDDLDQHAGLGRGQLQHHLVGLDVDQALTFSHRFTHLLVPGQQRGLGDRFG